MNDLIFVAASVGLWVLIASTLRDMGMSWNALTVLAGCWGLTAVIIFANTR